MVLAEKGADLLVLHFAVRPGQCPALERQRLLVKDKQGKSFPYGGWGVERAEYAYCSSLGSVLETGPWGNVLWTPVGVKPEYGFLDLVYRLETNASALVFTDGVNEIDLEPLLTPPPRKKKK